MIPDIPQVPGVAPQLITAINQRLRMVSGEATAAAQTVVQNGGGAGVTGAAALTLGFVGSGAIVGAPYSASLQASGGTPPYSYSIVGLSPSWLSLNALTGALTGTPAGTGTDTFTAMVTDNAGAPASLTVTISISASGTVDTPVASVTGGDASALLTTDPKYFARYADNNTGSVKYPLYFIPVLTAPVYPQVVALFVDYGDGLGWTWRENVTMEYTGQVCYVPDDQWAPTAGTVTVKIACSAGAFLGDASTGITIPVTACTPYSFTVNPVGTCPSNDISNAQFLLDGSGNQIEYTYTATGQLVWIPHLLQWTQPSSAQDVNYWYSFVTWQKGHVSGGTWVPASDKEGQNEDANGSYPGIYWIASNDLTGGQTLPGATIQVPGNTNSEWSFPPNLLADGVTPNPDRTYRFWIIAASRLGTTEAGGAGTFTLQTVCWPSGADHYDLTPIAHPATVDASTLAPNTLGAGIGTDGSGKPVVNVAGPNYIDITNSVNIRIASDFVVTTGPTPTLTQQAVDFAKAYHFGSEFTVSGGVFVVNAIAVNKLLAGSALFSGTATFAYSGGGIVTINSLGIAIADNNTTPLNTVTVTASGITMQGTGPAWNIGTAYTTGQVVTYLGVPYQALLNNTGHQPNISPSFWNAILAPQIGISAANGIQMIGMTSTLSINNFGLALSNGTNSVNVTPAGITILGPSGSFQATSSGIVIQNGSSSVTVAATGVTIVNGTLTSPVINGGALSGTTLSLALNGATVIVNSVGAGAQNTVVQISDGAGNLSQLSYLLFYMAAPGYYMNMTVGSLMMVGPSGTTLLQNNTLGLASTSATVTIGGVRVLASRVTTTPVTLADVIAVLQHHGLSN